MCGLIVYRSHHGHTYLLGGEILHRDSLGAGQPIRSGEVNWMTAGRGIGHSEPAFAHHAADALPLMRCRRCSERRRRAYGEMTLRRAAYIA
jgi:hypothetical protein